MGEFNATPDLSGYAKLSGASFTGNVGTTGNIHINGGLDTKYIGKFANNYYLKSNISADSVPYKAYAADGSLVDVGSEESFVFTLEDGSKVTKSIRVVSTTNS